MEICPCKFLPRWVSFFLRLFLKTEEAKEEYTWAVEGLSFGSLICENYKSRKLQATFRNAFWRPIARQYQALTQMLKNNVFFPNSFSCETLRQWLRVDYINAFKRRSCHWWGKSKYCMGSSHLVGLYPFELRSSYTSRTQVRNMGRYTWTVTRSVAHKTHKI